MEYLTVEEYAFMCGKPIELVEAYLKQGSITDAKEENGEWKIPPETPWPGAQGISFKKSK